MIRGALALALLVLAAAAPGGGRAPPIPDFAALPLPAGVRSLLADLAWMRAVQHYGAQRLQGRLGFPELESGILSAARLDPDFRAPAVSGALLLAEPPPFGPGRPDAAAALLRDRVERRPDDESAALVLGLVHLWHLGDPDGAARVFAREAARPDAPPWFAALAARSFTEAGVRDAARLIWSRLLSESETDRERANARTHLAQLDALDELDRLTEAIRGLPDADGWEDIVAAGILPEIPRDPAGVPYRFAGGAPEIAPASPLAGFPGRR